MLVAEGDAGIAGRVPGWIVHQALMLPSKWRE
jgi:hypothetical protein